MSQYTTCAVMVTYEPDRDVAQNIQALHAQVTQLVVVDNGSSADAIGWLVRLTEQTNVILIRNKTNLGIAAALNSGVQWAAARGFDSVFLSDQDSLVQDACVARLCDYYHQRAKTGCIGITIPQYIERSTGDAMPVTETVSHGILTARTSGSLIPLGVFRECGWFREDLFIDGVDFEYCLRIRNRGYTIAQCSTATLLHSLGARKGHTAGYQYQFIATHHNARRRYFITRNRLIVIRCYWRVFPHYCLQLVVYTVKDSIKIVLVEHNKTAKVASSFKGLLDGLFAIDPHNVLNN